MNVERWSGRRMLGDWSYIVKQPGVALEVVVCRVRLGRLWMVTAAVHELQPPESVPELIGAFEPCCELVGGACQLGSSPIVPLHFLLERYAQASGDSFDQPEEFWLGLEDLLEQVARRGRIA